MTEEEAQKRARAAMLERFREALDRDADEVVEEDGRSVGHYKVMLNKGEIRMILPTFTFNAPMVGRKSFMDDEAISADVGSILESVDIAEGNELVGGVGSSTSVDWYGTEMSLEALTDMEAQFTAGVSFFPRHGGFLDQIEWSEEFGRTVQATVKRAEVLEPYEESEPGWVLEVFSELYTSSDEMAVKLLKRLSMSPPQPIGMSIGGWFLEMTFIRDEESGDLLRIIVHKVLLDHIATVRSPANPDSYGLGLVRAVLNEVLLSIRGSAGAPPRPGAQVPGAVADPAVYAASIAAGDITEIPVPETAEDRHIVAQQETDNTVILQYLKAGKGHDDLDEDEVLSAPVRVDRAEENAPVVPETPKDETPTAADLATDTATNAGGVSADVVLDATPAAGETHEEPGAQRDTGTDTGEDMTPEELQALMASVALVADGQRSINDRLDTIEARAAEPVVPVPAPAPEVTNSDDSAVVELRKKIESLEAARDNRDAVISNLVASPTGRRGMTFKNEQGEEVPVPLTIDRAGPFIRAQLANCEREDIAPAVRGVVKQAVEIVGGQERSVFDLRWKARGDKPGTEGGAFRSACGDSEEILRSLCRAAAADGTGRQWMRAMRDA